MAGEHNQLVQLAHATVDPDARKPLMEALGEIAPYAGADNQVADQLAAHVLAKVRAHAIDTLARLITLDSTNRREVT